MTKETESRGYWSEVFYQATLILKKRPHTGGETAFWMARGIVDRSLDTLPLKPRLSATEVTTLTKENP